jgi:ketosteroid isomerase-like protein
MDIVRENETAARRCVDLFNQGNIAAWVKTCYAESAEWIELPLPTTPNGQKGNRDFLRHAAEQVRAMLPDRRMEIQNVIAGQDQVVLEIDWRGSTAAPVGALPTGTQFHYQVATVLKFVDGLIVREVDYAVPIRG